jgi:hypothetical protein
LQQPIQPILYPFLSQQQQQKQQQQQQGKRGLCEQHDVQEGSHVQTLQGYHVQCDACDKWRKLPLDHKARFLDCHISALGWHAVQVDCQFQWLISNNRRSCICQNGIPARTR